MPGQWGLGDSCGAQATERLVDVLLRPAARSTPAAARGGPHPLPGPRRSCRGARDSPGAGARAARGGLEAGPGVSGNTQLRASRRSRPGARRGLDLAARAPASHRPAGSPESRATEGLLESPAKQRHALADYALGDRRSRVGGPDHETHNRAEAFAAGAPMKCSPGTEDSRPVRSTGEPSTVRSLAVSSGCRNGYRRTSIL